MPLLTELENTFSLVLERCHAYGVLMGQRLALLGFFAGSQNQVESAAPLP
jgi:hypothetical protein